MARRAGVRDLSKIKRLLRSRGEPCARTMQCWCGSGDDDRRARASVARARNSEGRGTTMLMMIETCCWFRKGFYGGEV